MAQKTFPIVGISYHDFSNQIPFLLQHALGAQVVLSIEHENSYDPNAIIAYMDSKFLGYVRKHERHSAYSLIRSAGSDFLLSTITRVEMKGNVVWVTSEDVAHIQDFQEERTHDMTHWTYTGKTLPVPEKVHRLHSMIQVLKAKVEKQDPWDLGMADMLQYIIHNAWVDNGLETATQLHELVTSINTQSHLHGYADAQNDIQLCIDKLGSPGYRRTQAKSIIDLADSQDMKKLLIYYGDRAEEAVRQLPKGMLDLFLQDGESFVGHLYYKDLSSQQIHALVTLLAMAIARMNRQKEQESKDLFQKWLNKWDPTHTQSKEELFRIHDKEEILPPELRSNTAQTMLSKLQNRGYLTEDYQKTEQTSWAVASIIAFEVGNALGINDFWKPFVQLWNHAGLRSNYDGALNTNKQVNEIANSIRKIING